MSPGPLLAYGSTPAAAAFPARPAPPRLKPTTSAPPPFTNDLRENSFFRSSLMTSLPSPSQRRPSGSPSGSADTSRNGTGDRSSPSGSAPPSASSSSPADPRPGSSSRSGSNRSGAPARRSTPAAADAAQPAPPPSCHATSPTRPADPPTS